MSSSLEMSSRDAPLVQAHHLRKYFPAATSILRRRRGGVIRAVDGASFDIYRGETLGLVGESGCGKSTTAHLILMLERPTSGQIFFDGTELTALSRRQMRPLRPRMQMIFQDPFSSLDPRMTVESIIAEPMQEHLKASRAEIRDRVAHLLELVGLAPDHADRYPHEFSGGQRQRIGIARALALNPDLVVCDEPISALDVSIQAQIINLLQRLQDKLGLTYLFIAHDLSIVRHVSDRVAVMYLGKIVELADKDSIYHEPLHPYTRALLSAVPIPDPLLEEKREYIPLEGEIPSPENPPKGCNFNTRCPLAIEACFDAEPDLVEQAPGHWVACHLARTED